MTIEPKITTFKYRGRIKKGRQKKGGRRQVRGNRKGKYDKNNGDGWLEEGEER